MNCKIKIAFSFLLVWQGIVFPQEKINLVVEHKTKNLSYGLTEEVPDNKPVIALALSGGGARGLAQIGIIRALLEAGIQPDLIVGTSMGSIVGGLYAAGYSVNQMDSIAINTDWDKLLAIEKQTDRRDLFVDQKVSEDRAIFTLRLNGLTPVLPTALNNGMFIMNFLNLLTLNAPIHVNNSFDDLRADFIAVCTNLVTGEPVILRNGSLSQAMRASSSVSFFLSPVEVDSLTLVDGGLVANVPVDIAKKQGGDIVIAVNTTSDLHSKSELEYPWIVADQVVSIPMKKLNENQMKEADYAITPNLWGHESTDFSNIDSLILDGYLSTVPLIDKIKEKIDSLKIKKIGGNNIWIKNILPGNDLSELEKQYVTKYSLEDSVSTKQILADLNDIFSSGNYKNVSAEIMKFATYSNIKFVLTPSATLNSISSSGNALISDNEIKQLFNNLLGKPYNTLKVEEKLISLVEEYRALGYAAAQIVNVSFNKEKGALNIIIDEGRITGLLVEGNYKANKEIITREFPTPDGGFLSYSDIEKGLISLRSTNLFDNIIVRIKKN